MNSKSNDIGPPMDTPAFELESAKAILAMQRLLNLALPFIPATESSLKGEMLGALSIRPKG